MVPNSKGGSRDPDHAPLGVLAVGDYMRQKRQKWLSKQGVHNFTIWGEETPEEIRIKFCMLVDVCNVVKYTKFDDWLNGFG